MNRKKYTNRKNNILESISIDEKDTCKIEQTYFYNAVSQKAFIHIVNPFASKYFHWKSIDEFKTQYENSKKYTPFFNKGSPEKCISIELWFNSNNLIESRFSVNKVKCDNCLSFLKAEKT